MARQDDIRIRAYIDKSEYDKSVKDIEKKNKDLEKNTINIDAIIDESGFNNSLEGLKKQLALLEGYLGDSVLSPQDQQALLERMGSIKSRIDDLNIQIDNVDNKAVFQNLANLMTPLVGGLTAAGSALQLFGVENEKLNEILVRTTQLTIGLQSIQQIADARNLKATAASIKSKVTEYLTIKNVARATEESAAANVVEATTKGGVRTATGLATKAQILWNNAVKANPILFLVGAVASLIAGITLLVNWMDKNTDSAKEYEKAIDGTIIKNEELRQSYNDHVNELKDLNIEYQNLIGNLSDYQVEVEQLNNELENNIYQIENEHSVKLEEIADNYEGFWNRVKNAMTDFIYGFGILPMDRTARLKLKELEDANDFYQNKILQNYERYDKKLRNINKKYEIDYVNLKKDYSEKRIDQLENELDKEFGLYEQSIEKVRELIRSRNRIEYDLELNLETDEYERQLKELNKDEQEAVKSINDINTGLSEEEIKQQNLINSIQEKVEALRTEYRIYTELDKFLNDNIDYKKFEDLIGKKVSVNFEITGVEAEISNLESALSIDKYRLEELNKELDSIRDNGKRTSDIELKRVEIQERIKEFTDDIIEKTKEVNDLKRDSERIESRISSERINNLLVSEKLKENEVKLTTTKSKLLEYEKELSVIKNEGDVSEDEIKSEEERIAKAREKIREYYENKRDELEIERIKNKKYNEVRNESDIAEQSLRIYQDYIDNIIGDHDRLKGFINKNSIYKKELESLEDLKNKIKETYDAQRKAIIFDPNLSEEEIKTALQNLKIDFDNTMKDIENNFEDRWDNIKQNTRDSIADLVDIIGGALGELFERNISNKFDLLNNSLEAFYTNQSDQLTQMLDDDLEKIQDFYDKGIYTQEEYNARREDLEVQYNTKQELLEEEKTKKEVELKRRQAAAEKRAALYSIAIDTAVGVMKSWGQGGGLFGLPLAAIVAIQGALQSALVATQPLPSFSIGGEIGGKPHSDGGTIIEAERGEVIINKRSSEVFKPVLSAINSYKGYGKKFAEGGLIDPTISRTLSTINNITNNSMDEKMIRRIVKETVDGVKGIPIIYSETEASNKRRRLEYIDKNARF